MCMGANLSILIIYKVCAWFAVIIAPSPKQGPSTILIGWEGAQGGRQSERATRGEGAGWEGER